VRILNLLVDGTVNFFVSVATQKRLPCDNLASGQAKNHEFFRDNAGCFYGKNNPEIQHSARSGSPSLSASLAIFSPSSA
jgi:hypothetical protein